MKKKVTATVLVLFVLIHVQAQKAPTDYVNPLLGTATLWDSTAREINPITITRFYTIGWASRKNRSSIWTVS